MSRYLDKYIIYYADKWETTHRVSFAFVGLFFYAIQLMYQLWAICMIPVTIYLVVTLYQQNNYIALQDTHMASQHMQMKEQNVRITELHNSQLQALQYHTAVDSYYNEVLKSRGLEGPKLISKKIGKNAFELQLMPSK